ncbi:hypothetical protein F511_37423 [Dorcoceras hygrometricum]|uniref:Uncharacterized protein n=1 Tax=Dorcoceras hygrometricum TaxID=472368 RepID=A0A2Z7CEG7_9LAMI|nr:hypothetical protein F511_37423 [Dorcoceras hygrometricum]
MAQGYQLRKKLKVCELDFLRLIWLSGAEERFQILVVRDSCCGNCSTKSKDASIEDERQYRAPHLPVDLVVSRYETSG